MEFVLYFKLLLQDMYKAFVGFYLPCVTSFCKMRQSWLWVDFIYFASHVFLQEAVFLILGGFYICYVTYFSAREHVSIHDFGWILFTLHYKSVRE